ncbi:unnamed protein product [Symbiodinium sp. CCMP2592]|nr:unnamed protein product [Symbiodinium sp. CCMP2592]
MQLMGLVMAGVASATDYPATWDIANHGSVPAATVYEITTHNNADAVFPGSMSSGDVNGDGVNDFAYEYPVGHLNVHFGGISADFDIDSFAHSGSNGFLVASLASGSNGRMWGTIAGDVNNDGFHDVLFFDKASSSVKIIFGKASGWSSTYTIESMTWDGTDGIELTFTGEPNFAESSYGGNTPQILSGFDINNDGVDDIAVISAGSNSGGRVSIFFGQSTWSGSVDGSTDFDGTTTGFSFLDADNTRLGRGLAAGDINGDGIDDVVASSRSDQPFSEAGCIYVLYGGGTYSATIPDIYAHVDGTTGFRVCGPESNTQLADYGVSAMDFNGDGFSDLVVSGRGNHVGLWVLFGKASFAASVTLPFASGEAVSFSNIPGVFGFLVYAVLGKFNGDQYDDIAIGKDSNMYVVFGRASPGNAIDVLTLSGTDGFKVTESGGGSFTLPFYNPIDMTGDGSTDLVPVVSTLEFPSFNTVKSPYVIVGNGPAAGNNAAQTSSTSTTTESVSTSATTSRSTQTFSSTVTRTSTITSSISSTSSGTTSSFTSSMTLSSSSTSSFTSSMTLSSSSTSSFTSSMTLSSSSTSSFTSSMTLSSSSTSSFTSSMTLSSSSTSSFTSSMTLSSSSTSSSPMPSSSSTATQSSSSSSTSSATALGPSGSTTSQTSTSHSGPAANGDDTTAAEVAPSELQTSRWDEEDDGVNGMVIVLIVVGGLIMTGCVVVGASRWIVRPRDNGDNDTFSV